jgi:hypothetical protein
MFISSDEKHKKLNMHQATPFVGSVMEQKYCVDVSCRPTANVQIKE